MNNFLVLLAMVFLHFIADFQVQGILAKMKQRGWWERQTENYEESMYRNDHKAALIAHAFEWTFMVMIPVFYDMYYVCYDYSAKSKEGIFICIALFAWNVLVHYIIDNLEANKHKISLMKDQIGHIIQVVAIWLVYVLILAEQWKWPVG